MNVTKRNALTLKGKEGNKLLVLAHGYGCSQKMWDELIPYLEKDYQLLLFDHVGSGNSDTGAYDKSKYSSLNGYAQDVLEIIDHLGIKDVNFIGHSVGAMIALLAAEMRPEVFKNLILIAPSPCYINKEEYIGGFTSEVIDQLVNSLNQNFEEWAKAMGPILTGQDDVQSEKLVKSFCSIKPDIAKHFAMVTFTSDHRDVLPKINVPTHILQCKADNIAPENVGQYMAEKIKSSKYYRLNAIGHCPHLTHPEEVAEIIRKTV